MKKSKCKHSCYHIRSYRDIKENTKVMKLLFLAIIAITEVLGNQNKEDTIMKTRLNIEKKKGELLRKSKQQVENRMLLI